MLQPYLAPIERLNNGAPIIAPTGNWWETGVTFNAAAVYLQRSLANDPLIRRLAGQQDLDAAGLHDGVVAVHYRARPENDPQSDFARSFIGLAVFAPDLRLIRRLNEPVLDPGDDPDCCDAYGVEDPRITRIGDTFYMIYCGVSAAPGGCTVRLCLATSSDLLSWRKHGPLPGDVNLADNKDGVLFPEPIDGRYYLLHRPCGPGLAPAELTMHLASADSPLGPWTDCGEVLAANQNPRCRASWVGAGSVPIPLGSGRYLVIYHTGNYLTGDDREYDLDAAIFDFACYDPARPATVVTARLEPLMVPETPAELRSGSRLQVSNVLFVCGSYEYQDHVYLIYGGADTYTLAARVETAALLAGLEIAPAWTLTVPRMWLIDEAGNCG